jgi:predicted dehydrogenase
MYPTLIIGIRNRGMAWAEAVRAHPDFDLAGVADIDPEILRTRCDELGLAGPARHLDYREALACGRYRLVIVATPNHLHYRMAADVLEAGIPCVLEKPFTETLEQAEELVELARRKGLALVIGHNYRFKEPFMLMAEVIRDGRLGRLIGGEVSFHRHRPPRFEHERSMRYPLLFLQTIHHLDLLVGFLPSPIREIHSRQHLPAGSPWTSPSVCHLLLRCADGVLFGYRGSYECRGEQTPYEGLWRLEFERGDLVLNQEGELWQIGGQSPLRLYRPGEERRSSDELLLDTVRRQIEGEEEAPTSGGNNLATLRLLFEAMVAGEDATLRKGSDATLRKGSDATLRKGSDATLRKGSDATLRKG